MSILGGVKQTIQTTHRLALTTLGLALLSADLGAQGAAADRTIRLQEFEVIEPRASAQTMAPTDSRLEATQPESIISLQTIQNSIAPTAD